jgi:hypothetical protein
MKVLLCVTLVLLLSACIPIGARVSTQLATTPPPAACA